MSVTGEMTLTAVAVALRAGKVSSRELTEQALTRIASLNPQLGAYVAVMETEALAAATRADRELAGGGPFSPILGVPVAVKDVFDYGPTEAGSRILAGNVASRPADQVTALLQAGAVVLGKLATWEFAFAFGTAADPHPARNPWDERRTPAGSSSGAGVALAAHLAYGAIGTDTGGSVRLPAAACGVVGFKPTYGLLSTRGVIPLSPSLDHVGPMARTVEDVSVLFKVMRRSDHDYHATQSQGHRADLAGVRVGVPRAFFSDGTDPGVLEAFDDALSALGEAGAQVRNVELGITYADASPVANLIVLSEAAAYHHARLAACPERFGREFRQLLRAGALVPASTCVSARRAQAAIANDVDRALADVDVLAMPTSGAVAGPLPAQPPRLDTRIREPSLPSFTWVMNLHGGPAISVPCGLADGLPVGLQLCGPAGADGLVLSIAEAYERTRPWKLPTIQEQRSSQSAKRFW